MALTPNGRWYANWSLRDNNYKTSTFSLWFSGTLTPAEMDANIAAVAAALADGVSDAVVTMAGYSRTFVESAPIAPPKTSEVERKLVIPLGTAVGLPGVTSVEIPSPVAALETDGTDVITPVAGTGLADLITFLTSGLLTPGNGPQTHYGQDITRVGVMTVSHRTRKPQR